MKIFIPSKGRSNTIKTHLLLGGMDYYVIVHNESERAGTGFCGFGTIENYYFRCKKWKTISLICSKCCLVKNDELRYDENILTMDDYDMSIQAMIKYGKVLVNSYVWPNANHNQSGGLGKLSERGDKKVNDCKILMNKYPRLLRYKDRKNSIEGAEVCLRFYSEKQFLNWRNNAFTIA